MAIGAADARSIEPEPEGPGEGDMFEQLEKNAHERGLVPGFASMIDKVFSPEDASVILVSGDGGTGKTFTSVELVHFLAEILNFHVITNIVFELKTGSGNKAEDWNQVDPHPNVHTVGNMVELWKTYASIKRKDYFAVIVVVLDEFHKWAKRIEWWQKEPKALMDWWGENRKYRTVPVMITQKMRILTTQLLQYVQWHIQKSRNLTEEFNGKFGTSYSFKELAFLIKVRPEDEIGKLREWEFTLRDVVQVIRTERYDWTTDRNEAEVGDICYNSETSANFELGEFGNNPDWFQEFFKFIAGTHPTKLPDRIDDFFNYRGRKPLTKEQRTDFAIDIYKMHRAKGPLSDDYHPVLRLRVPGKKRLQEFELSPTNLGRITGTAESTLRFRIRKWEDADETSEGS
jgi:hypothetical protein